MLKTAEMRDLLSSALLSSDATAALHKICENAVGLTGGRNSMLLQYNDRLGYLVMRAGQGADWNPELLGERVNVTAEEKEGITAYVAATGESYVSLYPHALIVNALRLAPPATPPPPIRARTIYTILH